MGIGFSFVDRSAFGVQRPSYEVTVTGNLFAHVIDQAIDFEPTGTGSVGDYTITGNCLPTGANAQAPSKSTNVGIGGTDLAFRVVFAHNILKGRVWQLFNVRRAVIEGNVIEAAVPTWRRRTYSPKAGGGVDYRQQCGWRARRSLPVLSCGLSITQRHVYSRYYCCNSHARRRAAAVMDNPHDRTGRRTASLASTLLR